MRQYEGIVDDACRPRLSVTRLEAQDSTGATVSTGAIRAIVRREEGLLIAADEGIFYTEGDLVIRSPLTDVLADLDVLDLSSTGQGDAETVWVVALEGLYRVTSAALEMLEIPELTALPTAVGALDQVILLAVDDALIELDPVTLVPVTLPDVGPVAKIRVVGTEAWIATGSGLLRRDATGDYTRYTLSDAEAGEPVYDVAVDYAGRAIATSGPGVVRLDAGTLEGLYSAALLGNAPAIALDTTGNVWLGGSALTGLLIGEPIGFEATIAPIFATNCNGCHLHGTAAPAHDFTDYTEVMAMVQEILQRVLSGQMPPGAPLEDYEYDALELWSETGMNP